MKNIDAGCIVGNLIQVIHENREYLSELDGKIGDGDHGINMDKGFTLCERKLRGKEYSLSEGLDLLGKTLLMEVGGSMGPLYGMFFDAMATTIEEKEVITENEFKEMLDNALEELEDIGGAKQGDKTLLDTLIPAKEAFTKSIDEGASFYNALEACKEAAKLGWRSTESMIAKVGRASRLGERSRGVLDAGATSCYLILNSLCVSMQSILKKDE